VSAYIIRRLLLMIPTLVGVSLLVVGFLRLLPSDAVDVLVAGGANSGTQESFKELVDERLQSQDIDPAKASLIQRVGAERFLVDEQLKRDGVDPATAPDFRRTEAQNTLAREHFKDNIRERLGLDKNYFEQWSTWILDAMRGDLGTSIIGSVEVNDELQRRIPVSIELGLLAMLISICIALPFGVLSAVMQDGWPDYALRGFAIAMLAVPSFFLATLMIALSSRWWNYSFPVTYKELWEDPQQNLEQVLVPALILGIGLSGTLLRLTRAQMLEVLRQDYIRTARSKGLTGRAVNVRHAARNALIPIVTVIGLQVPVLVGGSLVLENIFGLPGVAQYLFLSIFNRDFPAIIAVNMVVAVTIVVVNLVVDVSYAYLDPRVKLT
jgi:peptide/nickel transport system permease protein